MNSGYLLKRLISVEVQDEERPTSPALLRSSSSHTPYSKDTSGNLSTTSSPTRVVSLLVLCCYPHERVSPPPFIAWIGRFPLESNMGTLGTDVGMAVAIFPPKLRSVGAKVGPADPVVCPAHGCRPSRRLSSWTLPGGPPTCVCWCRALYVSFLCQMGLFWMCNATMMFLCISVVYYVCFHVIPNLCPCNQQFTNTRGIR